MINGMFVERTTHMIIVICKFAWTCPRLNLLSLSH